VLELTGFSRAQLYRLMARGEFPRQISLTDNGRSVCWSEADVQAWQEQRIAASREALATVGAVAR
jgi:prophage regulatory protein